MVIVQYSWDVTSSCPSILFLFNIMKFRMLFPRFWARKWSCFAINHILKSLKIWCCCFNYAVVLQVSGLDDWWRLSGAVSMASWYCWKKERTVGLCWWKTLSLLLSEFTDFGVNEWYQRSPAALKWSCSEAMITQQMHNMPLLPPENCCFKKLLRKFSFSIHIAEIFQCLKHSNKSCLFMEYLT